MALEEFYQDLYRDIFSQWILLNADNYLKDQVICQIQNKTDTYQRILFDMDKVYGLLTIWHNNIIEQEVCHKKTHDKLFYLHYTIIDLAQAKSLFQEFYSTLIKHNNKKKIKIGLCCTGGFSTSVFAEEMQEACQLEDVHFELTALTLDDIYEHYREYDMLYLAPQIAPLQPELIIATQHLIPIHRIDPTDFATKNYQSIVKTIQNNLIKDLNSCQ